MTIRSGFFNSVNGDRKYDANKFAEYFNSFIGNGVFPNPSDNLQIMAQLTPDMTVTVKPGKAWINGYILINDDDYILQIEPADGVLNRIDRIVARYDVTDREIALEVKKGAFASTPTAPILQRDADAYELGLADILVSNGVISITQSNITDLRLNTEFCGIVHGTVDQVDTTTLFNQYLTWLDEKKTQYNADMLNWTEQKQLEYDNWKTQQEIETDNWQSQEQTDFDIWFATLQDVLDENTATNLLNMINATNSNLSDLSDDLETHKADNVSQKEAHGMRVNENGEFQYYNPLEELWLTIGKGYDLSNSLYYKGYENESVTGGWVEGYNMDNLGSIDKLPDRINLDTSSAISQIALVTNSLIDLSGINTLHVEWELSATESSSNASIIVSLNKVGHMNVYDARTLETNGFTKQVSQLDVSALNGNYYIRVHNYSSSGEHTSLTIYKVWGEI